MKAIVIERPHEVSLKELPYPKPGPDEVTVKVKRAGICGTDYHIYDGHLSLRYPIIPGHEFSGVVDQVGERVSGFAPGDRVTADPSVTCGRCRYCLTNRTNLCVAFGGLGTTLPGSMAEYVVVSARKLMKMPEEMSFGEAAFIEPVACVVHAMNRLQLEVGSRTLLYGAGAMGLLLVQALAHTGAAELVVVDTEPRKLELAQQMGATQALLASEAEDRLQTRTGIHGFDAVIDTTGVPAVIEQSFRHLAPAAKYLQFGVAQPDATVKLNPFALYQADLTFIGSMALNSTFLPAFQWVRSERIRVEPIITHTIPIEEALRWFRGDRPRFYLKTQITFE